jgi:hypothetical protein
MLTDIRKELRRIGARDILVSMDDQFEPEVGTLLKVENGEAFWHLFAETFQQLLSDLPDNAGSGCVHEAIEREAQPVWHGPAPRDARE